MPAEPSTPPGAAPAVVDGGRTVEEAGDGPARAPAPTGRRDPRRRSGVDDFSPAEVEAVAEAVAAGGVVDYAWSEFARRFGARAALLAMVRAVAFDAALARRGWTSASVLLTRPGRSSMPRRILARLGIRRPDPAPVVECGLRVEEAVARAGTDAAAPEVRPAASLEPTEP